MCCECDGRIGRPEIGRHMRSMVLQAWMVRDARHAGAYWVVGVFDASRRAANVCLKRGEKRSGKAHKAFKIIFGLLSLRNTLSVGLDADDEPSPLGLHWRRLLLVVLEAGVSGGGA